MTDQKSAPPTSSALPEGAIITAQGKDWKVGFAVKTEDQAGDYCLRVSWFEESGKRTTEGSMPALTLEDARRLAEMIVYIAENAEAMR